MAFAQKKGPAEAATSPSHGSNDQHQEKAVNDSTDTTAPAKSATHSGFTKFKADCLKHDVESALFSAAGATLFFRSLVLEKLREEGGSVTLDAFHVKVLHQAIDMAWAKASDAFDEVEKIADALEDAERAAA